MLYYNRNLRKIKYFCSSPSSFTCNYLISSWSFSDNNWLSPALSIGLQEAYNDIIQGEATVEEALQAAQEKADDYRQCIIDNDLIGSDDYQEFEACMEQADLSWENG